jgi:sulfur-oxidizing protein SoxB
MRLDNGKPLDPDRQYKVVGWATVNSKAPGKPVWDVVAEYLRARKTVKLKKLNTPKLKGISGTPGVEDYA